MMSSSTVLPTLTVVEEHFIYILIRMVCLVDSFFVANHHGFQDGYIMKCGGRRPEKNKL